ncbi:hypothetical protein ACJEBI_02100 [Bacillus salipaludis]|uniref:Uncharacterized protein n=2 Tax=Bacillus salipaludis TaxID=2547811 RepID=A0ABW8RA10_9BACI
MKTNKRIIMIILLILLVIGGTGCMNSEGKILNNIEDKYGEKFVVEGKKEGSVLFPEMYGKDKIFVHPEGKPELIFEAGQSDSQDGKHYDTYIPALWGAELTASLKDKLADQLPKDSLYKVYIDVAGSKYDVSMKEMSAYDYIKNVNKNFMVVLEVAIKTSGEPNLAEYQDGLYQSFEMIKNLQTKYYSLSVGFVDPSEDISDYIRTANVNNLPWSNLKAKVYGHILVDEHVNINSPDELISNYEAIKE